MLSTMEGSYSTSPIVNPASPPLRQAPINGNTSSDPFTDLITLIADSDNAMIKTSCRNLKEFRKFVSRCLANCAERGPAEGCYAAMRNVGSSVFERICEIEFSEPTRLTYDYITQQLIIKCMPGTVHEIACARVVDEIKECIRNIPGQTRFSVCPMGASRVTVPGVRSKEGDQGLKPTTRVSKEAWPSLMVEV